MPSHLIGREPQTAAVIAFAAEGARTALEALQTGGPLLYGRGQLGWCRRSQCPEHCAWPCPERLVVFYLTAVLVAGHRRAPGNEQGRLTR
jgi:hypothetical protein